MNWTEIIMGVALFLFCVLVFGVLSKKRMAVPPACQCRDYAREEAVAAETSVPPEEEPEEEDCRCSAPGGACCHK